MRNIMCIRPRKGCEMIIMAEVIYVDENGYPSTAWGVE